jgi:hypothetical protein
LATLKQNTSNNTVPANLPDREKIGDTRDILAQKVGVPQKKLETILEVGKLAETGKTKSVRLGTIFRTFTHFLNSFCMQTW